MGWFGSKKDSLQRPPVPVLVAGADRWVVVDVETSGLYPNCHRVLSVAALALDAAGRPERQVVSLIDAGCDPGPVHIHGLTSQRLAGSPRFADVLPYLRDLLEGRVLVAHNASFDYGFLAAEAARAGTTLPTRQRLCTLALSRRLGLNVPNHQLGTLASHWGVPHLAAHDALNDAQALTGVFAHSLGLAARLGMPLPVVSCEGHKGAAPFPARVVKSPCPWRCPGPLRPGAPLVQGMKLVITGDTHLPREELCARASSAGVEVMGSVSRLTSVLVCNSLTLDTVKAARARVEGTLMIDEATLLRLLENVQRGEAKVARGAGRADHPVPRPRAPAPELTGPLAGRRVLIIGGNHEQAAAVRAEVITRGGAAAVNLGANVTDVIVLAGGEADKRLPRARAAGVGIHTHPTALGIDLPGPPATDQPAPDRPDPGELTGLVPEPIDPPSVTVPVLPRGAVQDLPAGELVWTVNAAWRADALTGEAEVDVIAFLVGADHQVVTDEDFVFYNDPVSEDGAVSLSVDGDSEQSIRIDLSLLPEHCTRVVIAAALSGTSTFGQLGAVTVSIDSEQTTAATATLDAGTSETTMLLAEVYQRHDRWRVRAIGQGYDDGLAQLATKYGVTVD